MPALRFPQRQFRARLFHRFNAVAAKKSAPPAI